MDFKRVIACGDMHGGHYVGLTPPKYQSKVRGEVAYKCQRECFKFWESELKPLKPIHLLIHNGDATEGKGKRSGGNELIHPKRTTQANIATENIMVANPQKVVITRGTPYHVGVDEDFEDIVADNLNREGVQTIIKDHAFIDVNGTLFNVKHKIGGSSVPYSRATAISKENTWNMYWAEIGDQPRKVGSTVFLRSHVHYYGFTGDDTFLAVILPALQAHKTTWGARQCSGVVKFGFVVFDCYEDGSVQWFAKILPIKSLRQEAIVL